MLILTNNILSCYLRKVSATVAQNSVVAQKSFDNRSLQNPSSNWNASILSLTICVYVCFFLYGNSRPLGYREPKEPSQGI